MQQQQQQEDEDDQPKEEQQQLPQTPPLVVSVKQPLPQQQKQQQQEQVQHRLVKSTSADGVEAVMRKMEDTAAAAAAAAVDASSGATTSSSAPRGDAQPIDNTSNHNDIGLSIDHEEDEQQKPVHKVEVHNEDGLKVPPNDDEGAAAVLATTPVVATTTTATTTTEVTQRAAPTLVPTFKPQEKDLNKVGEKKDTSKKNASPVTSETGHEESEEDSHHLYDADNDEDSFQLHDDHHDDDDDDDHHGDDDDHHHAKKEPFSLVKYFTSSNFRFQSHVFGTMFSFFLVAMRVEGFLQIQCLVPEDDYSWDLPLHWSFVLELGWFIVQLAVSLLVVLTFNYSKLGTEWTRTDWKAIVAALLDITILSICIGCLLGSESQRCCDDYDINGSEDNKDVRFLAGEYGGSKNEGVCVDTTLDCTCPSFGYRVYGGLGSLEPWTALVGLQVFRFIVANKLVNAFKLGCESQCNKKINDHDHSNEHGHGHGHGKGHSMEVIADAWQTAVAKHPELVKKYGEFSGEILQAMLGLDVTEHHKHQHGQTSRSHKKVGKPVQRSPRSGEDDDYSC